MCYFYRWLMLSLQNELVCCLGLKSIVFLQDNDEDREASRELFPTKRRNSISEESGFGLERIILKIPKKQLNLPEQQQQQQHLPDAVKSPILVSNIEVSADCPTEVEKKVYLHEILIHVLC